MSTGMASGRVRPIVYFKNASGYIILAPQETGHGLEVAKMMYERKYKHAGWMWCETDGSFHDAEMLQKRLQEQELSEARAQGANMMAAYDASRKRTEANMRAQMTSAACSPFEREFITLWLQLNETKRREYEQRWAERQAYLWAIENDAGTKIEDRMPSQPGDVWRTPEQQRA